MSQVGSLNKQMRILKGIGPGVQMEKICSVGMPHPLQNLYGNLAQLRKSSIFVTSSR